MSPIAHKLGAPWPHPVVCAVADDWAANNRFASAALGTVMWTVMGAYHNADWGKRAFWSDSDTMVVVDQ